MKHTKKTGESQMQEQHVQYLQQLRDKSIALHKLINKLEEREQIKSKPVQKPDPEV